MSESLLNPPLEREDFNGVTVMRVKVSMLPGDETTDAVFEQASAWIETDGTRVALNLAGVDYMASAALGKLVQLVRKIRSVGGKLVVCRLSRTVEKLMELTHLSELIPVYGDEREAVQALS